jgi:carbon-monoxide dehydrogenase medium subunit
MFATDFEYLKATSVAQAIQLLGTNPEAKLLAGGHSLIPLMKLRQVRAPAVIDIGGIDELRGISINNGTIHIGALTTHREIETSPEIAQACHIMTEVAGSIGDPQVRNRGTIGGNVVHADPASDWPTVLTALRAEMVVQGRRGARNVPAAEFFTGLLETSIASTEILTGIEVPRLNQNQLAEYAKMAHPATHFAVVGGAVVVTVEGGRCTAASVVVGGLVPMPLRARSVETALVGQELTMENITAAAEKISIDLGSNVFGDSVFASADFRRMVVGVEVKHALFHAVGLAHHDDGDGHDDHGHDHDDHGHDHDDHGHDHDDHGHDHGDHGHNH